MPTNFGRDDATQKIINDLNKKISNEEMIPSGSPDRIAQLEERVARLEEAVRELVRAREYDEEVRRMNE